MPKYTLRDSLYNCDYRLYVNITCDRFISIMEKYLDDTSILEGVENVEGMCVTGVNGGGMVIYIREFDIDNPHHIATLVHECMHVTQRRLWRDCGIDSEDLEATAYHVSWLVDGFLSKIRASTRRQRADKNTTNNLTNRKTVIY